MKKALLFLVTLVSISTTAAPTSPVDDVTQYMLMCGTETATVKIWTENDRVMFRYDDLQGFQNFPLFEGVLTMPMVAYVDKWTKELSVFKGHALASWPRNKCKFDRKRPYLMICSGRGEIQAPAPIAFTTSGVSTLIESSQHMLMDFERVKVTWGIDTNSEPNLYFHYFVTFPFSKQNCQAHLK